MLVENPRTPGADPSSVICVARPTYYGLEPIPLLGGNEAPRPSRSSAQPPRRTSSLSSPEDYMAVPLMEAEHDSETPSELHQQRDRSSSDSRSSRLSMQRL